MTTVAPRFGISDVALKKTCAKANVPVPERGYWAKRAAGKKTVRAKLPPRGPGESDVIVVGGTYWSGSIQRDELLGPIPDPPTFEDSIEAVRDQVTKRIRKVPVPTTLTKIHPAIAKLLSDDEKRREKQRASPFLASWYAPKFDTPLQRRRLRILNAVFLAVAHEYGAKASIRGEEADEIGLTVGHQEVGLELKQYPLKSRAKEPDHRPKLSLAITGSHSGKSPVPWQDDDSGTVESKLTAACVEIVVAAEQRHRDSRIRDHQWRIVQKARIEEEDRQRKAEAERKERERLAKLERERVDRLLSDAELFARAKLVRSYLEAVQTSVGPSPGAEVKEWIVWALAQADLLDPIASGRFLVGMTHSDREKQA